MTEDIVFYAAAILVGIISTARLTRLITQDEFPPSVWFRIKWDNATDGSSWNTLFHCHWCLAPWLVIPVAAWAWFSDFHIAWWILNGWLAASYLVSIVVEKDEVTQ